jgi:hypothetical protein
MAEDGRLCFTAEKRTRHEVVSPMDDVMQVDDSYFGAVPGDLRPSQVDSVVERLRKLIRSAGE